MATSKYAGCIRIREVDTNGAPVNVADGWLDLGEVEPMAITLTEEIISRKGRTCQTAGLIVATYTKAGDAGGNMTLYDFTVENVAMALKATVTENTVSGTAVSAHPVTVTNLDRYYDIGTKYLSNVTVQDVTDSITYDVGEDYVVESTAGVIKALSTGDIDAGDILHVSATGNANSDKTLAIGAGTSAMWQVSGTLVNEITNEEGLLELDMVRVTLTSDYVFVSSDDTEFESMEFELVPMVKPGQTSIGSFGGAFF